MQFRNDTPIFLQIVESVQSRILAEELLSETRIPAVRELAVELQVNPNTVVKSFTALEEAGVIYKKRGLGYFVAPEARERILETRRKEFLETLLPQFVKSMKLLGVSLGEIQREFEKSDGA